MAGRRAYQSQGVRILREYLSPEHSRTTGSHSQEQDLESDLTCPVCLSTFDDPCFVCSNHHTLCRNCYKAIVSINARCPQCRERLTSPVQNSQMLSLIKARDQPLARRPRQATCEATTEDDDDDDACQRRATSRCEHCSRDLCDWHFSADQLEFQTDCQELLEEVDDMASEAKRKETVLAAWDSQVDDCINFLERQRLQFRRELTSASSPAPGASATALRADAAALRGALDAGDLRAAKAASDRLAAAASARAQGRRGTNVAAVPTPEQTSHLIDVRLAEFVCEMQQLYRNAAIGGSKMKLGYQSQSPSGIDEDLRNIGSNIIERLGRVFRK